MNKKILSRNRSDYERLEQVVGCKWSVSVLEAVRQGVNRPGALERCIEGISTKVLSERLRKLTDYGLLNKQSYAETWTNVLRLAHDCHSSLFFMNNKRKDRKCRA
jgi:DNA-binding HxlR family transcriptional regulator